MQAAPLLFPDVKRKKRKKEKGRGKRENRA
jgi:hypothetical protein